MKGHRIRNKIHLLGYTRCPKKCSLVSFAPFLLMNIFWGHPVGLTFYEAQFWANLVILKIPVPISDSDNFYQSIKLINSTTNQKTAIYPLQISISFLSQTLFINVYASSSVIEFNFLISVQIWPINPCCISFPKSLIGSFVVNSFSAQQREKIRLIIRKL